jgi:SAM-dependent methyltransferase
MDLFPQKPQRHLILMFSAGKYFPAIWEAGSYVIGTDISLPLLQQAAYRGAGSEDSRNVSSEPESRRVSEHRDHLRRKPAVAVADCMNIPMRTKSCDAAICIAVMHHLSTKERRLRCISELARIVKVGGLINIQAWAMEQQDSSRRKFAGTDVFVPFNAQPKYLEKNDSASATTANNEPVVAGIPAEGEERKSMAQVYSEEYNAEYDEKKGLVVFKRYCHLYRAGELEEIVAQVDGVSLRESGYESGNHFVILKVEK